MTKKYHTFIVLFFSSVVIFFASEGQTTPNKQAPLPGEPVANFPKMMVGDSWVTKGFSKKGIVKRNRTIIEVKSDGSFVVEVKDDKGRARNDHYNNKYQLIESINVKKGSGRKIPKPPGKSLDFPLFVGKKWNDEYDAWTRKGFRHFTSEYSVKKYETVNTKAGPFMAFKIIRIRYIPKSGQRGKHVYWYSPEAKRIVKSIPDWRYGSELLSYKLAPVAKVTVTATTKKDTTPPEIYLSQRGIKMASSAKKTVRGQAIDESGVALVYINNMEAQIDEKGNFQADILLKPGVNNVVIEAIDIYNNKATKTFTLTRKPQVAKKIEPKEDILNIKGKYYAFIIGINNYKYLDSLQTAVNDAEEVERVLRGSYGFETTSLINQKATRGNIVGELNNLRGKLSSDDKLLIYYAGHGYFDENTKKAYWLPVDAERNNDTNWIMAERITSNLKRIPAKHILVVSDSCYSGTLTRTAQVDLFSKKTRLSYINKILNKEARVLIASGGNEPVADSGGAGHSVFAESFIKALKQADKKVFLAEELFVGYIKESVAGKADQIPEYSLIKNSGHDGGDFIFMKKSF